MAHWVVSKVMSLLRLLKSRRAGVGLEKPETTLRSQLVLLVVASLVPLFGLAIIGAVLTANDAVDRATENLQLSASLVATNQTQIAESARQLLTTIANTPGIVDETDADCRPYFEALTAQIPFYANLGIIGADGYVRCDAKTEEPDGFAGDRLYFQQAVERQEFVTSGFVLGRVTGKPLIMFALPVLDGSGSITAVAFAAVYVSRLSPDVANARLPSGGRVVIADQNGLVLVASPENSAVLGKPLPNPLLQTAFGKHAGGIIQGPDSKNTEQIYAFATTAEQPDESFFVAVSASVEEILAPSRKRLLLVFLALTLVALLGSWIAWVFGGRMIALPASRILKATSLMQEGRLDVRIPLHETGKSSELTRIAEGVNSMAEALEQREGELAAELARTLQTKRKLLDAQRLGRIAHWELDVQAQRLDWSDGMFDLYGVTKQAFDGRHESFLRLVHPQDRAMYEQGRKQALLGDGVFEIEYRIITAAGKIRWMLQRGQAHAGKTGQPEFRDGVVQDITARKTSELALAHSNELLRSTGEMAMVGGWELTADATRLDCSEQFLRIYDLEPDAHLTIEAARRAFPHDAGVVLIEAARSAIKLGTSWDLELPMVTTKGRSIWVRSQGRAVVHEGKTERLAGTLQDITAQHNSREHLRLLETSISRLNDIVLITKAEPSEEPGPSIVFVNDAFERLTGYSRAEVIGKSPRFLQGPKTSKDELARIHKALKSWQPVRAELINYKKNGEEFWIELDIVPIADASGLFTHWVAVERDITERKLTEQALLESEQRYAALFDAAPVPLWVYDVASLRFVAVNRAAVEGYGYTVDEFMSMSLYDIRPASEHAALRQQLTRVSKINPDHWLHSRKDGSTLSVNVVSKPIQFAGRNARFVMALDISVQQKAETEVREHLFTLQRAADAAQAIAWHQTLEGTVHEVAEQARGVIGAHFAVVSMEGSHNGLQPLVVRSSSEKYDAQSRPVELGDGWATYADLGKNRRSMRLTQGEMSAQTERSSSIPRPADAREAKGGLLAVPLTGRSGKNIGLLQLIDKYEGEFSLQDEFVAFELAQLASSAIENAQLLQEVNQLNSGLEQKVSERTAALTRQEALFRALADQAPQVVWTADSSGLVTYVNRAWLDLVGGEARDWMGVKAFAVVHPQDLPETKAGWKAAVAGRSNFVGTRRMLDKAGVYHTMSYRASPVFDDAGAISFWVGIDADISEIKTIEAALRLSNQELEAFSYSVSHDLRSPLNTIDGFSRLLGKQLAAEVNPKALHYLSRIQAGVAQMGQLIEDMLAMAQVSRMQLRHESIDLSALSLHILEEWQARAPHRHVRLHVEPGLHTQGDSRLIKVVMENLLGNAWKFTSREQDAEISVGCSLDASGSSVFFVRDNGAGFDMAYADKLFTAFQRLHSPSEFSGTGVGLATVSRVIGRHAGQIWAEAAPGKGATFFFTLPQLATSA